MRSGFTSLFATCLLFALVTMAGAEEAPRVLLQPEGTALSEACDSLNNPVVVQSLPSLEKLDLSLALTDFLKENPSPDAEQISQKFQAILIEHGYPRATVEPENSITPHGRLILKVKLDNPAPPSNHDFSTPLIGQSIDWHKKSTTALPDQSSAKVLTDIDDEILDMLRPASTPPLQYKVQNSQTYLQDDRTKVDAMWINPSNSQQSLSYGFSSDPGNENAISHGGGTTMHLPWGHDLDANIWQWQSEVEQANAWSWKGEGLGSGLNYAIPLPNLGPVKQSLTTSLNYSKNTSSSKTDATDISTQTLETEEMTVSWNPSIDYAGKNWMRLSTVWSPGNLSPANRDSSFISANSGTDSNYRIFRMESGRETPLPDGFSINTKVKVQMADTALTTGALAPLDDYSSYHIGSVSGDEGYTATGEFCLPKFDLSSLPVDESSTRDFQLFAFSSFGRFYNKTPQGSIPEEDLLSIGPGATIKSTDHLSFNFAYGWQFEDQRNTSTATSAGTWANASLKLDF